MPKKPEVSGKGPAKKKPAKHTASVSETTAPSKRRWLLVTTLKLMVVSVVVLAFYTLYLDSVVKNKFEGQRWHIPVQVYGDIPSFYQGAAIDMAQLKQHLLLSGYKKVNTPSRAGEFAMSASRIIIFRRAFDFGQGKSEAQLVTIDVKNARVVDVYLNDEAVQQVKVEPYLIARIVPESKEDRVLVPLQQVPEALLDTLLLVEDRDFYFHKGISPTGIARALYSNLKAGRTVQGGSTLTQQLVKNMFLTREKTLTRKFNEAIMSLLLEYRYSKDQLLEAYINEVYLGQHYANGIYGFGLAAQFYFGKPVEQLTIEQMATLVGVIKGPSYYDPWRYQERVKSRRDVVLQLLFEHDYIDKPTFISAIESPLSVKKQRRMAQTKQSFPAYMQLVKRELAQILPPTSQQSGIRVFTHFSLPTQLNVEAAIDNVLPNLTQVADEELQAAMVVSDITNGGIVAIAGGKESGYAGFNRALNAQRPIGSLIKPVIYIAALERYQQYQLGTILEDKPIVLSTEEGQEWRPKNYDGQYRQHVSLLEALVYSLNVPTVNLGMKLGLDSVLDVMHLLGAEDDIVARPSILLGAVNMSPLAVNTMYYPIANHGKHREVTAVERIYSSRGELLWQGASEEVPYFSEQASFLLDHAMTKVTTEGTAKSLSWRVKGKTLAGKTGTTNDQRDSWFVGYDEKHLVTSWVGYDDNRPTKLTGSSGALVVFADFIRRQPIADRESIVPENIANVLFDVQSGKPLPDDCDGGVQYPAVTIGLPYALECQSKSKSTDERSWFEKLFGS
ncbi:penicillin-binding protein 1B [Thalassotalea fusca]